MDEQEKQAPAAETVEAAAPAGFVYTPSPQPENRRPIRHMIWAVCLIAFALMLLGQILGEIVTALSARALGIGEPSILFLLTYLSFIGIDLVVLLYTRLCERPIFRSFGRRGPNGGSGNTWKNFGLGLLIGFAMNALCILAAWLHGDLDFSVGRFNAPYLLAALVCVCIQSGAEELLTRGYMMGAVGDRYNVWVAASVNSLFFGALHLLNPGITVLSFVNVVAVGFALSVVMIKLESLWFCIAVHTAWNFSQSIFFGLPNSGIVSQGSFLHLEAARVSTLYDPTFGVEGVISTTFVLLVLVLGVLLYARRRQKA